VGLATEGGREAGERETGEDALNKRLFRTLKGPLFLSRTAEGLVSPILVTQLAVRNINFMVTQPGGLCTPHRKQASCNNNHSSRQPLGTSFSLILFTP
jgi:hypothetical protein